MKLSPTFERRLGFVRVMHLLNTEKHPVTHETSLPSDIERVKRTKQELKKRKLSLQDLVHRGEQANRKPDFYTFRKSIHS